MNFMKTFITTILFLACIANSNLMAQVNTNGKQSLADSSSLKSKNEYFEKIGDNFKKPFESLENLDVSGYYRFITNYRQMSDVYTHLANNKNNIFVGDDSQIPQLMLNINGYTSSRTSFGTDLYLWTPLTGLGEKENVKGLNLGVSLYGNFSTKHGNYAVKTGGINWYSLSPFTFQASKGYNRYSLFERNPWDPNTARVDSRYSDFYSSGAINQDQRWGNQAFQGLIVEGAQLPGNLSFSAMYGKTQFDGGLSSVPNSSFGGRLVRTYGYNKNFVSFNTFNNSSNLDSMNTNKAGFNMATIEQTHYFGNVKVYSEIGAGRRFTNNVTGKWGEAISIKTSTSIGHKVPTEVHLYRVSPNVFNNSSVFINSSIQQTTSTNALNQPVLIPVSSAMLPIGQLSNNRQGIELNSQIDIGKFKTSFGYSAAAELESLSPKITYGHAFNNLSLSRFWRWDFPSEVGPYQNLSKIYRSVYETVYVTKIDTSTGRPLSKKYFNTIEINTKYKTMLAGKELYLFYLGSYSSVQNFASPFVVFKEKALIRAYSHQLETYYKLNSKLVWTNYFGAERIIANYDTRVDVVSRRPKNQKGISIASGMDIQISKGVGLYLRERWMNYQDMSFANDKYRGFETTVELKMFF